MKKILSLLLALALVLTAIPLTIAFAENDGVYVVADGKTYRVSQGDTVTYAYYLNVGEKVTSITGDLNVDTDGLEMIVPVDEDNEPYIYGIFPILDGAAVVNDRDPAHIHYNFSNPMGKNFNKDTSALIRAQFTVTAATGTYHIDNPLTTLAGVSGTKYIEDGEVKVAPARMEGFLIGLTPYDPSATESTEATVQPTDAPTEPPTDAPATQPTVQPTEPATDQPTTPLSDEDIILTADGKSYLVHQGDVFEYVYYLNIGEKLCSLDGDFYYSADGLALNFPEPTEEEADLDPEALLFPKLKFAIVLNAETPGQFKYNYSNSSGKKYNTDDSVLVRASFTVTAASGEVSINNLVHTVAGENEHKFRKNDEELEPLLRAEGGVPELIPIGGDPTTATVPATEAATSEETRPSTEPATAIQTQPSTEPATAVQTDAPATDAVFVVADGVTYKVHQGEIFEYIYYFSMPDKDKLCSLEGEFFYDGDGLEMIVPEPAVEEQEDYDIQLIFKRLWSNIVLNTFDNGQHIKYNFSSADGKKYDDPTYVLIKTKFRVTAASGTYEIKNLVHTVAGQNEKKYIYNDVVLVPIQRNEGAVSAKNPYDPDNPEPETEAPTDPPTDPPTEAPTPAPTDPPTEAPTPAPTEKPTDPPTEKPTDPPTEQATEKPIPEGVFVKADGVLYRVSKGEVFTYKYFLNTGERVCSLEADLYFDNSGLELIVPKDEDEEEDITLIFPIIKGAMTTNVFPGHIKYNYSNSTGKAFKFDTARLIEAQFTVTADSGVYEINNILHCVAGQDEHKYIFNDEVVDPLQKSDSELPGKEPFDPDEPVPERKYGDTDGDGDITIVDVSFIQRHLAGINPFDAIQLKYGDVDGDGEVTIIDGTYIQRWLAGLLEDNPFTRFGYPRQ